MDNKYFHQPVLLNVAVESLINPQFENQVIVDATTGGGGYSELICSLLKKNFRLVCLDKDLKALDFTKSRLNLFNENVYFVNDNFANIKTILNGLNINSITGIVYDLGLSSNQLESVDGFSFTKDSPLDMRADERDNLTAADVLNSYDLNSLKNIFENYGEIGNAKRLASKIFNDRRKRKFKSTFDLVNSVKEEYKVSGINAVKFLAKIFQALRIEVNNELNNLTDALNDSYDCLAPGGRMSVVSYHSLEDRIVKYFFRSTLDDGNNTKRFNILTKKPVIPDYTEIKLNNRSRSAKLRVAEKV